MSTPLRIATALIAIALLVFAGLQLLPDQPAGAPQPIEAAPEDTTPPEAPPSDVATGALTTTKSDTGPDDRAADRVDVSTGSGAAFGQGVVGRIVDPSGKPVSAAQVFLMEGTGPDIFGALMLAHRGVTMPAVAMAETDAQGRFRLGLRRPARDKSYEVRAIHDRFADASVPGLRLQEGVWHDAGDVSLPHGMTIFGRVTVAGSGNLPVPGALVYAKPIGSGVGSLNPTPGREKGILAIADEAGNYRFENLRVGLASLSAVAPGFAKIEKPNCPITPDAEQRHDFELPQGKSIAGIVTDGSGAPIARAKIVAQGISSRTPLIEETVTDKDGRFEVIGLVDGPYGIAATAIGFVKTEIKPVQAGENDQHIVLERQCSAELRVTTRAGRLIRSYQLALKRYFEGQEQLGNVPEVPMQQISGRDLRNDGTFTLTGLDPGGYVFEVVANGFAKTYSEPFLVALGADTPHIELELNEGGRIRGRLVSPDGRPVAGATVTTLPNYLEESQLTAMFGIMVPSKITRTSTRSDSDGSYLLEKLTPGTYQLKFTHPDFFEVSLKDLVVAESQLTEAPVERLAPGTLITGRVDVDGTPTAHVKVSISTVADPKDPQRRMVGAEAITDAAGEYTLNKRLPPGRYSARAARQTLGSPMMQVVDFAKTQKEFELGTGLDSFVLDFSIPSVGR